MPAHDIHPDLEELRNPGLRSHFESLLDEGSERAKEAAPPAKAKKQARKGAKRAGKVRGKLLTGLVDKQEFPAALKHASRDPGKAGRALESKGRTEAFFALVEESKPYKPKQRSLLKEFYDAVTFKLKRMLVEAQFSVEIDKTVVAGKKYTFSEGELDTIMEQAFLLPPGHVDGMESFQRLVRGTDEGPATYNSGSKTITMSDEYHPAAYSKTFRHEVGHAVDTRLGGKSENLRTQQAGWTRYANTDAFIRAAGGYGDIPAELQPKLKAALDDFRGGGGTFSAPGPLNQILARHMTPEEVQRLSAFEATNVVVRTLFQADGGYAYTRFREWATDGSRYFSINHWYAAFFSVGQETHADLDAWGNTSPAFSDKEWFAEVYASWYAQNPPGSERQFPGFVQQFFRKHVEPLGHPGKASKEAGVDTGNPKTT